MVAGLRQGRLRDEARAEVSDPVKTEFGYHVIKLIEKRAASQRPLAEVRGADRGPDPVAARAGRGAADGDDIAAQMKKPGDFDTVAKPRGLTVAESGMFAREEPIAGLGMAPAAAEQAFELKDGEVSDAIRTPQGFAFITVTGKQDALRAEARRGQAAGSRRRAEEEGGGRRASSERPPLRRR